jgi:hypothetical protein
MRGLLRSADASGGGPTPEALPCLYCNNSIQTPSEAPTVPVEFPAGARRTAFALQTNIVALVLRYGIEHIGFLTLTFSDHVIDSREASRRLNSFLTNVLRPRYRNIIAVMERQKSGRIHYHLLVVLDADIRTGVNFFATCPPKGSGVKPDYRTAPAALRAEWVFLRHQAKLYRFGRTELMPIRSTAEAIGRYVGKYIAKHIEQRQENDLGVRLVRFSGQIARTATTRFAWAGPRSKDFRLRLGAFVHMLHGAGAIHSPTYAGMRSRFGKRWAWRWRDQISTFPLPTDEVTCG